MLSIAEKTQSLYDVAEQYLVNKNRRVDRNDQSFANIRTLYQHRNHRAALRG